MTAPELSAALIIRDDASTLEALLQSIRPHVDEIVVVDTGSVDGSPDIARRYADKVVTWLGCNDPDSGLIEDFAAARNYSFDLASKEWCCWFDGDDVVEGGQYLRELAAKSEADNKIWMLPYEYSHDAAGRCTTLQYRERLVRPRHKLEWKMPVHEYLGFAGAIEGTVNTDFDHRVRVIHRKQHSAKQREVGRNLRILRKHVAQVYESDIRALHYLGFEYAAQGEGGNALRLLKRHVALEMWPDQRMLSLLGIAEIYRAIQDWDSVIYWAGQAIQCRSWPEPYWALCRAYYHLGMDSYPQEAEENFRKSAHFGQLGMNLNPSTTPIFTTPMERFDVMRYLGVSLSRIGEVDAAIEAARHGLSGMPEDEMLQRQLNDFEKHKLFRHVGSLGARGVIEADHATLIQKVLDGTLKLGFGDTQSAALQAAMGSEPAADYGLAGGVEQPGEPAGTDSGGDVGLAGPVGTGGPSRGDVDGSSGLGLDVIFYLGHGLEPWNPTTFATGGMGGSETMAWEMARRLAKLGHKVRLYGHCTPRTEGVFEGVHFLDASKYRSLRCDVLIASRDPGAVDDAHKVQATARVLWVHDIHCGPALNEQRALRIDLILCLSKWHKAFFLRCYPSLSADQVEVTRNGIDLARFTLDDTRAPPPATLAQLEDLVRDGALSQATADIAARRMPKRNPHKAIWSSSPDRGLQTALEAWPSIRKEVPGAELHIFYGFGNWEKAARMSQNTDQIRVINHLKHLSKNTAGVFLRDRVNQVELAREMVSAGVWFYPTWFSETSCISAMEAQAAGLRIVTSPIAALVETVGDRGAMISTKTLSLDPIATIQGEEYRGKLIAACVRSMADGMEPTWARNDLRKYAAEHFGLDTLAADWSKMLTELVAKVSEDVVPRYRGEDAVIRAAE